MASAERQSNSEAETPTPWDHELLMLKIKLRKRKPTAVTDIKATIAELDGEMQALSLKRELVLQNITENRQEVGALESQAALLTEKLSAADRAMKRLNGMLRSQKATLLDIDEGKTPEMEIKPQQEDYLQKLFDEGKLDGQQLDAAHQIARIYEASAAAMEAKIGRMDGTAGGGGGYQDIRLPENLALARAKFYLPWGLHLREHSPITLDIVLRVAVYGAALKTAARHNRMRAEKAEAKLKDGLDAYWKPCSCHSVEARRQDAQLMGLVPKSA